MEVSLGWLVGFVVFTALYMLPTIVAYRRKKTNLRGGGAGDPATGNLFVELLPGLDSSRLGRGISVGSR